jgi:hypothetical protein
MIKKISGGLDFLGMSTSLICALHCSLVPLLLSFGAINGTHLSHNHYFDIFMVMLGFVIATFSLWKDFSIHRSLLPVGLAGLGFFLLFLGVIIHLHNPIYNILGGLFVCIAHIMNYRTNRSRKVPV